MTAAVQKTGSSPKGIKPPVKRGCLYWIRLLSVGLVGGLTLAYPFVEILFLAQVTAPAPSRVGSPSAAEIGFAYEPVTIVNTKEDIRLAGWYAPSQNGAAVILLHGYGANRTEMAGRAAVLARYGFGVLLYDERGEGESTPTTRAFGWPDDRDVAYAIQFLLAREDVNPERIGVLGFSTGGMIAIRAAAEDTRIRAVIADDPGFVTVADAPNPAGLSEAVLYGVSWIDGRGVSLWTGIRPPEGVVDVIGRIAPRPILIIGAGQSEGMTEKLYWHYYEYAREPKSVWEIPESPHGGEFFLRPQEYEQRMVDFFTRWLNVNPA